MPDEPNPPAPSVVPDLEKLVKGLLSQHGDPTVALKVLARQNRQLIGENHDYRDQIKTLRANVVPEGGVVLTGDDAKRWDSYRGLGEPGDVKKSLRQAEADAEDLGKLRRAESYRAAAKVAGYKADAFATLAEAERLEVEIGEAKGKDGKPVPAAFVKGEGEQLTPLADHVKAHWQAFAESLGGTEAAPRPVGTPPRRQPNPPPPPPGGAGDPIEQAIRAAGIVGF